MYKNIKDFGIINKMTLSGKDIKIKKLKLKNWSLNLIADEFILTKFTELLPKC